MSARMIDSNHPVAYLCAEFGFDSQLPFYMGGLGILAGDTLKAAVDQNLPLVGVGLLYRGKMLRQTLDHNGRQVDSDQEFDPVSAGLEHVYQHDCPLFVSVQLGTQEVWLRCWKKTFSDQVTLYLLDANTDQNLPEHRHLTELLYIGDPEYQLKQQILHGVGAAQLLTSLGLTPRLYHFNEGRPIFAHWQLLVNICNQHRVDAQSALQILKSNSIYTNHTLIPAGNQSFPLHLVTPLAQPYADQLGISVNQLLSLGSGGDPDGYSMTMAALNITSVANGVSSPHTELSQKLWPDYHWVNVTNGVHRSTWQRPEIVATKDDSARLWSTHLQLKKELQQFVLAETGFSYDPNWLVISWARRIVGYKQLEKIIEDADRLKSILSNVDRPIQLLIAGKAHPGGEIDKDLIAEIIKIFSTTLAGHALFVPNYRIVLAQRLVAGSDIWINTPSPGNEACGTSGMKAISNGVLQLTTVDGWTVEVDWRGKGWTLEQDNLTQDLYTKLEEEIAPLYYNRDEQGLPLEWLSMMRSSIESYELYSADRMLREYKEKMYTPVPSQSH